MNLHHSRQLSVILFLSILLTAGTLFAQTKLLRFPDIHGDTVVFCYGGNLWKAPSTGGVAVRLTTHPGQELFPKFSPDGKWIAFTGQYDGDEQVYVVPAGGGIPRQLTYYPASGPLPPRWGYDNQVYGWTPDGKKVLFRSLRDADGISVGSALYTVSIEGGLPVKLPMPTSGSGDFSPDGKQIIYSPLCRDFRTWKRYEGGWAQDLYIFNLKSHKVRKVAPDKRTERDPMWIGNTIYFASDRDGTLNLYAYKVDSDELSQITHSQKWDVRWPSSDNKDRIVYELNGELQVFDMASGQDSRISISVPDDGLSMRPSRYSAEKNIEDFELSPKGERALFVARGDIFTAPIEKGPVRNLTNSSNAHDKWARWSPNGKKIAFISDLTGEDQVYLIDQDGMGKPEQMTKKLKAMQYPPEWAPDGKRLAFSDKDGKLYILTIADKKVVEVAYDKYGRINDYAWSANGGHLAFSMTDPNQYSSIYIWSVADNKLRRITGSYFNEYNPEWDTEGNYLYYLSERQFAPQISTVEWNFATNRQTSIFVLALRKDVKHPFPPESDEVTMDEDKKKEEENQDKDGEDKDKKEEKKKEYIKIDFDGLAERVTCAPVESNNINGLSVAKDHLIYMTSGAGFYGRDSYEKPRLNIFTFEKREDKILVKDISNYALSADNKKVLVQQEGAYNLYDVKPEASEKDKKAVSTKGLMVDRVPAQEWEEIFNEVWRRFRDFFYVKNMHGYNWKAIGDQYKTWLKHVAHRSDLNYVIGEMISELSAGHCYIVGGDFEIPDRPKVALPGARFELDKKAGRYRISKIFKGDNEEEKYKAPLMEVGIDASVGDYVLAIDGEELKSKDNPYQLLQHKTDPVILTLNSKPTFKNARKVTYNGIGSEANLIYLEWVGMNREKVTEMTDGRVGYIHIPDMGSDGIYEFIKWYYPQIRKEGLVVDVRSNGGGNVSSWIIERLDTRLLGTGFDRLSAMPDTYPYSVFHGHKVCLINETSASDGDIFPYFFRESGLGPLIGKRSWGGVIGIMDQGPLLDGGQVYVPQFSTNDGNGKWIIEGYGVDPDIEVENDPESVIEGRDPQLERGIQEVLKKMAEKPMKLPSRPAEPVKTK
ncbi:S41 family peptidase [Thermodesulfobacteriota bacterium]